LGSLIPLRDPSSLRGRDPHVVGVFGVADLACVWTKNLEPIAHSVSHITPSVPVPRLHTRLRGSQRLPNYRVQNKKRAQRSWHLGSAWTNLFCSRAGCVRNPVSQMSMERASKLANAPQLIARIHENPARVPWEGGASRTLTGEPRQEEGITFGQSRLQLHH
jgi:hypothetical protein